jgi:cell division initiation protein
MDAMKTSPMDIQRQNFARRFRGFDRDEVRSYLNLVAEEVAELQKKRDELDREVQRLRAHLEEHREREAILKNTLLTAQRVSEEIKENARKSAESTVKEAELQADRLVEMAQGRAQEVERHIVDLRLRSATLRSDVRTMLERLSHILDLHEEAEAEDNLRFLRRKEGGA